jgi:hypothetical protein
MFEGRDSSPASLLDVPVFEAPDENLLEVPDDWEPIPTEVWVESMLIRAGDFEPFEQPQVDDRVWLAGQCPLGGNTITLLTAVPFDQLSPGARSHALQRLSELSGYLEALKVDLTAVIAGPAPVSKKARLDDFSPEEIAIATNSSVYAADAQIALARAVHGRLAATGQALHAGTITVAQARKLSESTSHLSDDIAVFIEEKMLKYSHRQSLTNFTRCLDRWIEKLDPDWKRRAEEARRAVIVEHSVGKDGTGSLYVRGPLEDTLNIHNALAAFAARTKHTLGGTADARKFAGLREWAEQDLMDPATPTMHGRVPTVNVTIDLATLLGLRDGTAEIPGVGAIPAHAAAWLLADGAPLRRLVIDPLNGQLLDYGDAYPVPPPLADYLIARNITSATPHSTISAEGADMEHNIPHQRGGPSNPINTTPVERRWHRAKTHGDWTYAKDPRTGVVTWTSPTSGLTCIIEPYDYRAGG